MSQYISSNELSTFQFHDACFKKITRADKHMLWELEAVNVTTRNSQNDLDVDMKADNMLLTFENCSIERIHHFGHKSYDKDWNLIKEIPGRTYSEDEYPNIFKGLVDNGGVISCLKPSSDYNSHCSFDILTPFDGITIVLNYAKVTAEWNEFLAQAWYLKYK